MAEEAGKTARTTTYTVLVQDDDGKWSVHGEVDAAGKRDAEGKALAEIAGGKLDVTRTLSAVSSWQPHERTTALKIS